MPHPSRAHLDAMGIPLWVRRRGVRAPGRGDAPEAGAGIESGEALPASHPQSGADRIHAHRAQPHQTRIAPPRTVQEAAGGERADSVRAEGSGARALEAIDAQVRACRKCALHRTRRRTVFGTGRPGVACMVVGEAPGAEEDARGEPFVGRAGKLLDAMLAAIGLARDDVYIANVVKCRPPRNRDPHAEEIDACSGYLDRQIEVVSPRLIVASGRVAAQSLLSTTKPIGQLRGRVHHYGETGLPVLVTYHPAYFLRSPLEKRKAWDDLVRLRSMLAGDAAPAS